MLEFARIMKNNLTHLDSGGQRVFGDGARWRRRRSHQLAPRTHYECALRVCPVRIRTYGRTCVTRGVVANCPHAIAICDVMDRARSLSFGAGGGEAHVIHRPAVVRQPTDRPPTTRAAAAAWWWCVLSFYNGKYTRSTHIRTQLADERIRAH